MLASIIAGCSALLIDGSSRPIGSRPSGCPDGEINGVLEAIGERLVLDAGDSETIIDWPPGYEVRREAGVLVVVDPAGRIAAREGNEVVLYGEQSGLAGHAWVVCGGFEVVGPGRASIG